MRSPADRKICRTGRTDESKNKGFHESTNTYFLTHETLFFAKGKIFALKTNFLRINVTIFEIWSFSSGQVIVQYEPKLVCSKPGVYRLYFHFDLDIRNFRLARQPGYGFRGSLS